MIGRISFSPVLSRPNLTHSAYPMPSTKDIDDMLDFVDRQFENTFKTFRSRLDKNAFLYPYNTMVEKNEDGDIISIIFEFCLAGIKKEEVSAEMKGNVLNVSVMPEHEEASKDDYIWRGIAKRKCVGNFIVSKDINTAKMIAKFEDGILRISLPIKKEVLEKDASKKIKIV